MGKAFPEAINVQIHTCAKSAWQVHHNKQGQRQRTNWGGKQHLHQRQRAKFTNIQSARNRLEKGQQFNGNMSKRYVQSTEESHTDGF